MPARLMSSCRLCLLFVALFALGGCLSTYSYQAYPGPDRPQSQIAVLEGQQYLRQDWLNRYVDAVRFFRIDGAVLEESANYGRIELLPGPHEVTVYFYWDLGSQRGLAQALVQYASSRQTLSRTLNFNAEAGNHYTVMAAPVFAEDGPRDITNMAYVDFWIVDEDGNEVGSREQGRYISIPR